MGSSNIYIRADGNQKIGLGHVSRSLALAEMLQEYYQIYFLIQQPGKEIESTILKYCKAVVPLPNTSDYKTESELINDLIEEEALIILDGYSFTTEYQAFFKSKGHKVICIDDLHAHHIVADVVVNHAEGINEQDYSKENYTKLFHGMSYALIKRPFRDAALSRNKSHDNKNDLLICMGGADPNNDIFEVLEKIKDWTKFSFVHIVIGSNYKNKSELMRYLSTFRRQHRLYRNLDADELVEIMKLCQAAILPPSTMSYEYMSVGGLLILKQTADNQKLIKNFLLQNHLALDFDLINTENSLEEIDPSEFIKRQSVLLDGKQSKRFLRIIQELQINCVEASEKDCQLLFEWANDPVTRQQSFSSEPISYDSHTAWFSDKLLDAQSLLLIAKLKNEPIGQIRFDSKKEGWVISYSLDRSFRGRGLGTLLLQKGIEHVQMKNEDNRQLIGFVKKSNVPSIKAFRSLGFVESIAENSDNSLKFSFP